ncbi:MAG: cupin domain-containing protein [Desulfomicrobium escambiense]|nr:cupin domain-containing protein [Desulfomicrobium escambiense]
MSTRRSSSPERAGRSWPAGRHDGRRGALRRRQRSGHARTARAGGYIVCGSLVLSMDGREETLGAGDSFYVAPDVLHSVHFIKDSVVVDTFTPQREDFL